MFEAFKRKRESDIGGEIDVTFKPFEEPVAVKPEPVEMPAEDTAKRNAEPLIAGADDLDSNIELKVVRPAVFDEVSDIADYLLDGCTVVLNLELLDEATTHDMLHFLNGVTYCTDGEIRNVSRSTYIVTPHNVNVSGEK